MWELRSGKGDCKVSGVMWKIESMKGHHEMWGSTLFVTEQIWGGAERYKRSPLFLWGFLPYTRFALPAARGKMSLNARDWWKGKELLFIWNNTDSSSLEYPQMHTVPPSPSAQPGVQYLRKEVEVHAGSWHHPCGKREQFQSCVVLTLCQSCVVPEKTCGPKKRHQMAATPEFKSQHRSSSAAPFPAPPENGHSCQHSRQVWPSGVEPIISKLFWTPLQIPIWGPPLGCTLLHIDHKQTLIC